MIGCMSVSVLVVDDDAAFRLLAKRILAASGLEVAGEADTAAAALVAADALRPHAILVDVHLPDSDGVTLTAELTRRPWAPRVVLTSSDARAVTAREIERSGARAFVPKDRLPSVALAHLLGAGA